MPDEPISDSLPPARPRSFTPGLWLFLAVVAAFGASALVLHQHEQWQLADELQAVSKLRDVFSAQETFRASGFNDLDQDQKGEYGHLGMLCGAIGSWGGPRFQGIEPGTITFLGPEWASPDAPAEMPSCTAAIGRYHYASFLAADTSMADIDGRNHSEADAAAVNNAEIYYTVVAVPVSGFDGPVLVITNGGTVYRSPEDVQHHVPAGADAAAIEAACSEVLRAATNGWGCFDSPTAATTRDNRQPRWGRYDAPPSRNG